MKEAVLDFVHLCHAPQSQKLRTTNTYLTHCGCVRRESGGWILIILSYFTNWFLMGGWGAAEHKACWVSEAPALINCSFLVQLNKKMPFVQRIERGASEEDLESSAAVEPI